MLKRMRPLFALAAGGRHEERGPQPQKSRPRKQLSKVQSRVSVLDALGNLPLPEAGSDAREDGLSLSGSEATPSPYLQPSSFGSTFAHHRSANAKGNAYGGVTSAVSTTVTAGSSVVEMKAQQAAVRSAFDYADKHNRVRMKKDKVVYAAEVRAFRAAHGGCRPTAKEVSRFTDVSLPPVTALNAMAHLDPRKSPMYKEVQHSLLLQQTITRSELMKSNARTLVRCLSCFHVYGARPRDLWGAEDNSAHGGASQQSWVALENEKKRIAAAERLMTNPKLRKKLYSVGRRRAKEASSPTQCPKCGSPRAQWAMEYIHYRAHAS